MNEQTQRILSDLYRQATGTEAGVITPLAQSGSNRHYFRICPRLSSSSQPQDTGRNDLIGVEGTSREENHAFLYMAGHFAAKQLNIPHVLAQSDDEMYYVQQDLGQTLLFDYIAEGRKTGVFGEREKQMLRKTIRSLARFQIIGTQGMDYTQCYPQPRFNRRSILWDLNYFKYCFLKATEIEFQEDRLENDFEKLADILLGESDSIQQAASSPIWAFMYRDFQSRNVMVVDGEPYFIDFQGGREGPVYYDVASFLWQAKANFNDELRQELIGEYLDEIRQFVPIDTNAFHTTLRHFVLFRTLQVLGAYGFRGYFEKKPHFLQSIPFAIDNLRRWLDAAPDNSNGKNDYLYLKELLQRMTELKQFKEVAIRKPLVVRVYSFSYKKGIPADDSGNGGGFVFDCRAVNNPGKYERYNAYTGQDEPVIRFLEDDGEILTFLQSAYRLVDASVKRYMERGFQHLMVSFGCTGGQHRSVYAAEKMAEHIHTTFGVTVQLIHRELNRQRQL
ncbi:MAG: phosphotransferase [Paludibacteraceae bacterium]|nr:phosphotransferase [Paludibacteraceae bacterium]